jgi:hypothetical protein
MQHIGNADREGAPKIHLNKSGSFTETARVRLEVPLPGAVFHSFSFFFDVPCSMLDVLSEPGLFTTKDAKSTKTNEGKISGRVRSRRGNPL